MTDIQNRIATRAYYMSLNNQGTSDIDRWITAEDIEWTLYTSNHHDIVLSSKRKKKKKA